MFINKDSITINSISMGQYLVEAKYGYNKLWGKNTGRNLNGSMTGTLLGIFPKLTLQFRKLTKTELESLASMLDSASQSVTYYDPKKGTNVTMTTYSGDWEVICKRVINGTAKCEPFGCSFISTKKRV